jgi:hypothetical protein
MFYLALRISQASSAITTAIQPTFHSIELRERGAGEPHCGQYALMPDQVFPQTRHFIALNEPAGKMRIRKINR